jgi:hypothetical protein
MQKRSAETTVTVPVPDHAEIRIGTLLQSSGSRAFLQRCSSIERPALRKRGYGQVPVVQSPLFSIRQAGSFMSTVTTVVEPAQVTSKLPLIVETNRATSRPSGVWKLWPLPATTTT